MNNLRFLAEYQTVKDAFSANFDKIRERFLTKAIRYLSEKQAKVLKMRAQDLTYQVISEEIKTSPQRVCHLELEAIERLALAITEFAETGEEYLLFDLGFTTNQIRTLLKQDMTASKIIEHWVKSPADSPSIGLETVRGIGPLTCRSVETKLRELGFAPEGKYQGLWLVQKLDLPDNMQRVLRGRRIRTIAQLTSQSEDELIGGKLDQEGVKMIVRALAKHGFTLAENKPEENGS